MNKVMLEKFVVPAHSTLAISESS